MASLQATMRAARSENPGWLKWAIALTVSLGALMEVIDVSIVNVALPSMQSSMGATLSQIGWVITGYAMANVVIIPLGAWLSEYFGQRNYYLFTLVAFVAASLMCGLAGNLSMLVVARILQGLFGGGLLPKAQSILFETFPPHEHGIAQSVFGIGVVVGPAFGPTMGGYLTDAFGWRSIFFINIPVGILAVLMAYMFIPDKPRQETRARVDYLGILFLAACLASMQVVLEEGRSEDWFSSPLICWLSLISVAGLALFIWQELRIPRPAVNIRVLRYRPLWAGSLYSMILGLGLYGTTFVIPVFTQTILHYTATQTGELMIPGSLMMALFMPMAGTLVSKLDARVLIGIGSVVMIGVILALSHVNASTSPESFFWPLMARGLALSFMFIPLSVATLGTIPRQDVAAAAGLYNLTRQIGGGIGIAILTAILDNRFTFHEQVLSEHISAYSVGSTNFLKQMGGYLQSYGYDTVQSSQAALKMLSGIVQQQALILSFEDVYYVVAALFALGLLLLFFLGKGNRGAKPSADAH